MRELHLGRHYTPTGMYYLSALKAEASTAEGLDERRSHLGRDDVLAVRLAVVGGEFRQKLVVGMPAEALSPVAPLIFARIASATSRASGICCTFSVTSR
jgi:hypothetical protein